ncbi:MAG: hypothetical protein B6I20_09070 [Bacteroidetes bacterium 4572_117]|nr:MAG: hypothetical protein B6I20_09070 [Bacteroidetes bacterium 4572_117]
MRIFIENNWQKVNNFIDYVIGHFHEKGKHNKLMLKIEDVYDKKLINKRISTLQGKLLVGFDDSFEILDAGLLEDFEKLKEEIVLLSSEPAVVDKITNENYKEHVIEFDLEFTDNEVFASLSFKFINLI